MASQYRKIEDFPGVYWEKESPVSLEKMRLARDTYRGVNVLQLTFRNISNANIYGLSISITMKDFNGRPVLKKNIEYNYYGMEVGLNKTFGSDDYIYVEPEGKSFQISVTRAEFSEGAMFRGSILLKPMPEAPELETLGEFWEPFTQQLLSMRPKAKILCAPEDKLHYWRCTCTRFYPHTINKCLICNLRKDELLGILKDLKAQKRELEKAAMLAEAQRLEEEEKTRLEEEERRKAEEERLAAEAEQKKRTKKKIQKYCAYASSIVILLLLLVFVGPRYINIPVTNNTEASTDVTTSELSTLDATPDTTPDSSAETDTEPQPSTEVDEPDFTSTPLAILGQDLKEDDLKLVLRLIGMDESDFHIFDVIYISTEEEFGYLTELYDDSLLGGRSLSSLLITPTEPGTGLQVTTYNITYCTEEMYRDLLLESGITDANVVVAAPFKTSGTAALAGIMKAGEHYHNNNSTDAQ